MSGADRWRAGFATPWPFRSQEWGDVAREIAQWAADPDTEWRWRPVADIVRSVLDSDVADQLGPRLTLSGLDVADLTRAPAGEAPPPPVELIRVSTPWSTHSSRSVPTGSVEIEHRSHAGRNDRIMRPGDEAVALFWRFVAEKFGIVASRAPSRECHEPS